MQRVTNFIAAATTRGALRAAGFRDKVVKLIVPFPPGGNVDAVSRTVAPQFQKALGGSAELNSGTPLPCRMGPE